MDKKKLFIGLGILAVGGLVWYFMKGSSSSEKSLEGAPEGSTEEATKDATTQGGTLDDTLGTFVSTGSSRKQKRVNCRAIARQKGLRGKEKRQFRRACRQAGGYDDMLDM
jgi:hypothetical protein